jgi:hypothetical protein
MAKEKQTIQWPKKNRQYNGQRKTDNTMAKERQTIQWPKEKEQKGKQ